MKNNGLTVNKIIDEFRHRLADKYGEAEVMQFIYLLFHEWRGWSKAQVHLESGRMLEGEECARLLDALRQLEKNKPIQYIIGVTDFFGVRLKVHPGIFLPRPETEELAALILRENQERPRNELSLLDIGTGSGCLAISLKMHLPEMVVTAIDISEMAVRTATENSVWNGTPVKVIRADILNREEWKDLPVVSIIVSNPPYVTESEKAGMHPNVLDFEPHEALFVGDQDPLLFYKSIAAFADEHLSRPGQLFLEINERFGNEVREVLLSGGFSHVKVMKDIHGRDRFVIAGAVMR